MNFHIFVEFIILQEKANPDESRGRKTMGLKPQGGHDRQPWTFLPAG